jgi:hypothetical protein
MMKSIKFIISIIIKMVSSIVSQVRCVITVVLINAACISREQLKHKQMHHCFNLRKLKWRLGICRLTRFHLKTCRISFALYPKAKKKKRKPFYQESYFVFVIRSYEKF